MSLTLDEPAENDAFYEESSLPFVLEKSLFEKLAKVKIDYRNTWMGKSLVISGVSKFPGSENACPR